MSGQTVPMRRVKTGRNATSRGRADNASYRVREHLTEAEMDRVLAALKRNRHGQRDWLIGLLIYGPGLRVSETCDLRWDNIHLAERPSSFGGSRAARTAATTWSEMNTRRSANSGAPIPRKAPSRIPSSSMSAACRSAGWVLPV